MRKRVQMWVYPEFAQKIKIEAINSNKNIIDFTKELNDNFDEVFKCKKKERNKYEFKF